MKFAFVNTSGKHHFFATSVANWETSDNLEALIKRMKREGFSFSVWAIPLPSDAPYEIRAYAPQVEGAINLGLYEAR